MLFRLCRGILFIPVLANTLTPLHCTGKWPGTSWTCFEMEHLAVTIAGALVGLSFLGVTMFCKRVFLC